MAKVDLEKLINIEKEVEALEAKKVISERELNKLNETLIKERQDFDYNLKIDRDKFESDCMVELNDIDRKEKHVNQMLRDVEAKIKDLETVGDEKRKLIADKKTIAEQFKEIEKSRVEALETKRIGEIALEQAQNLAKERGYVIKIVSPEQSKPKNKKGE